MTPKSLLRLPAASSSLEELATGTFQRVLGDAIADDRAAAAMVERVLVCTGKIYYELVEERRRREDDRVAIVRLEELYPWWPELVAAALRPYPALRDVGVGPGRAVQHGRGRVRAAAAGGGARRAPRRQGHVAAGRARRDEPGHRLAQGPRDGAGAHLRQRVPPAPGTRSPRSRARRPGPRVTSPRNLLESSWQIS
ncbi:MAG: hypothetical protein R2939_18135 [Kofleriaceae bacterium]